jgi:mevalonate kinase
MTAFAASAPGKIILFGEHAVVYGEPAIAAPLHSLQTKAIVTAVIDGTPGEIYLEAADISLSAFFSELETDHPLRTAVLVALGKGGDPAAVPSCRIQISSTIPTASGLGSGAAVSAAIIRALSAFLGNRLSDEQVSQRTFEVEKILHGNPSGIDNTVIAFQRPIYFHKDQPFQFLKIPNPFKVLVADSGIQGHTGEAVQQVRQNWKNDPEAYQNTFHEIGQISHQAKQLIQSGSWQKLGPLMDQNHRLLQNLQVSHPALDRLVAAAREAGALGAKLSGGGLGGNVIALVDQEVGQVTRKLVQAGARSTLITSVAEKQTTE